MRSVVCRFLVALFVFWSLGVMLLYNLDFSPQSGAFAPMGEAWEIASRQFPLVERFGFWTFSYLPWLVGLNNRWQMFAGVDRGNWYLTVSAIGDDGTSWLLPLPHQERRSVWEQILVDYREDKFQAHVSHDFHAQNLWAQYLCRSYATADTPIGRIRILHEWHPMYRPQDAVSSGRFFEPVRQTVSSREFRCDAQ